MRNFFYGWFCFIFHLQSTEMRKCIGFITAIFLFANLFAQQRIDNLQRLLMQATKDTTRIDLLNRISANYVESRPDSTLRYANDALMLSKKTNYNKGEIDAMRNLGLALLMAGDYSKSLEFSLEALKSNSSAVFASSIF